MGSGLALIGVSVLNGADVDGIWRAIAICALFRLHVMCTAEPNTVEHSTVQYSRTIRIHYIDSYFALSCVSYPNVKENVCM